MHQILSDYISRFDNSSQSTKQEFFTQYSLQNYKDYLPYLFNIENFCLRLNLALENGQKICVYSDYDTDAVTATGVMWHGLLDLGFEEKNLTYYAPDRFTEGYGLNPKAISKLSESNQLIISVDCGINSILEAEIVKQSKNCDLIITDHHHLYGQIPDCVAVVNPRLSEFYNQNPDLPPLFLPKIPTKYLNWAEKTRLQPELFNERPERFVSSSVTGVGVAWFCLVWFSYFLEEMSN